MNATEQIAALPERWEEEAHLAEGPRRETLLAKAQELRGILNAPQPPPNYHYATEEERKCLPVGYLWRRADGIDPRWKTGKGFRDGSDDNLYACPDQRNTCEDHPDTKLIRDCPVCGAPNCCPKCCKGTTAEILTPALVTFDNGKLLPPPFGEWHRSDGWTPEMLEGGYRPLMLGEVTSPEDQYWVHAGWYPDPSDTGSGAQPEYYHRRTRRPLPAPPKEPEWVPLGPEDVPPGSVFKPNGWKGPGFICMSSVRHTMVCFDIEPLEDCDQADKTAVSWRKLFTDWLILRPGQDWQPCRKLKQEGAV